MYDRYVRYARERHAIYERRTQGLPRPWTDDKILDTYRFTNVFRELDATTVWYRENVRERYDGDKMTVLFATVVFRLINRIKSGEAVFNQTVLGTGRTPFEDFLETGDFTTTKESLRSYCGAGPYVTGAYIINSPNGMDKLTGVLTMMQWVWNRRDELLYSVTIDNTLASATKALTTVDHIAKFTAYEVVTDLRHTCVLRDATDIMTWANPGPGAKRGLNRLYGRDLNKNQPDHVFVCEMRDLLEHMNSQGVWPEDWPRWDMRDVEHTLCEFDKYERVRLGEGRPRGVYR